MSVDPSSNRVRLIITRALLTAPAGLTWDEYGEIAADGLAADGRAIPNSAATVRCAYCGGDAADRPVSHYSCCAACYERMYGRATRNRVAETAERILGLNGTAEDVWQMLASHPEMRKSWLEWLIKEAT